MLKITKNQANNLIVTVTEKTTITPAYYLLSLYSNDNMSTKVVRLTGNTSPNIVRYDKFVLSEVPLNQENLETAKINLNPGTYDYIFYATTGSTGTTITNAEVTETGLLKVLGSSSAQTIYTSSKNIITFE